mgnify:CR=1 FL=1
MNQERILVVTATLGYRESLKRTIESVRAIGGSIVRHIIIAPQSKIALIKERFGNIECLAEPEGKKGIYAALNYAFQTYGHNYNYLTFINDDDYWLPNYQYIITELVNNPSLDMVYGRTQYVNSQGIKIGTQACSYQFMQFIPLLESNIVLLTQQATLIKSELYFKIGGFDESYKLIADTKFWAQLSLMNIHYKYLNKECAAYTIQDGQLSSDRVTQRMEHERLLQELNAKSYKRYDLTILKFRLNNLLIYINRYFKKLVN